ncbi:MAG: DUF4870 domain-containing protein [Planctomycetota bacterium]|jgi:uncharacterized Tic20 family protein
MEENVETPESFEQPEAIPEAGTEPDKDAKMWAMFCHLAGLATFTSIPFAGIIAPLIIWQIKKDEHPFIDKNGKEAVNFQISIFIYLVVSALLVFAFIGIFLVPAVVVFNLALLIIAGIKANNGESYQYPLCIRFIK